MNNFMFKTLIERKLIDLNSEAGKAYQKIKASLEVAIRGKKSKVIGFISVNHNEGKSTALLNIANSFASIGKKVLVIDADNKGASLHLYFALPNEKGLSDIILDDAKVDECIVSTGQNFDLITSGKEVEYTDSISGSDKISKLLDELKEKYDLIFVNVAPTKSSNDAVLLAHVIEGFVLVIKRKSTKSTDLDDALKYLTLNQKVNLIGFIATNAKSK